MSGPIVHEHAWTQPEPRLKIKVESHGAYGTDKFYRTYEVSYEGADLDSALPVIIEADAACRARFCASQAGRAAPTHTHICPTCHKLCSCAGTTCDPAEPRECITCSNCKGW
jgi:hypothetical protein